jgi:hypothetical protein
MCTGEGDEWIFPTRTTANDKFLVPLPVTYVLVSGLVEMMNAIDRDPIFSTFAMVSVAPGYCKAMGRVVARIDVIRNTRSIRVSDTMLGMVSY